MTAAVAARASAPLVVASSIGFEQERILADLSTAADMAPLLQVLGNCDALWQLPGTALLLSEQLLAGLPCDWCCNNPGCFDKLDILSRVLVP
jgi:hypothetical protein